MVANDRRNEEMKYTLIYKRTSKYDKQKEMEAQLSSEAELGRFVYNNQPMQVIAVCVEIT